MSRVGSSLRSDEIIVRFEAEEEGATVDDNDKDNDNDKSSNRF